MVSNFLTISNGRFKVYITSKMIFLPKKVRGGRSVVVKYFWNRAGCFSTIIKVFNSKMMMLLVNSITGVIWQKNKKSLISVEIVVTK